MNPQGGGQIPEFRTGERKRFYASRNHKLVLFKHSGHILPLTAVAFAGLLIKRRWSRVRTTSLALLLDCWRLRGRARAKRRPIRGFRRHGDEVAAVVFMLAAGPLAGFQKIY